MRLLVFMFFAVLSLEGQVPRLTEVQERRLANGTRLLLVERRGLAAFHATLVFRGGRAEEPASAAGATDLLARVLYGSTWPEDLELPKVTGGLDALLKQEEGLLEAIRLERLRLRRDPAQATQLPSLEASLESLQSRLRGQFSPSPLADVYTSLGGRQGAEATADALFAWTELPRDAFAFWCRTEVQRLRLLQLSHFAQERAALATGLHTQGLDLLRGAALPGHPYGRDLADHRPALEALRWSDLRAYARHTLRPDRLTIILVGDLDLATALPLLERHFGALPVPAETEEAVLPEIPADLGDRRVQAALGAGPRLLMGWRIPPRNHPDHLALRLVAQLLDGGKAARLQARLVLQKGLAREARLQLDVPGGHLPGLLCIDLKPAVGHSLAELEAGLHGEVLRLQQEPIPQEEWLRALARLEGDFLQTLDEPASLARALGVAWAEGGDWRLLDLEMRRLRALTPETIQSAARAWLQPSHRTTARLEPAPADGSDPVELDTGRILNALATSRIQDPAQREHLVAEGLRQLRMLSPEERRRTLKLLEGQLPPSQP